MKNKIIYILAGVVLTMASSCTDWLDPKPLNNMVLDDYWKKGSDVESVVLACYRAMAEEGFMERIILGGELRSDNVIVERERLRSTENQDDINNLTIKPTNGLLSWKDFYLVINLCNTVLEYAPQVTQLDPDYTPGFLRAHEAEARTLRALAYFYLVRLYRDVPYIDFSYSEDTQEFNIPQMNGDTILNLQVKELLIAERYALKSWGYHDKQKGRVTKNMVRVLLADICLWLGKYDECIEACNRILPDILKDDEVINPDLATGAELVLIDNKTSPVTSFYYLFNYSYRNYTYGYGRENIFELQFNDQVPNKKVKEFFGDGKNIGHLAASGVMADIFKENKKDLRGKTSFTTDDLTDGNKKGFNQIFKYIGGSYSENSQGSSYGFSSYDPFYCNWIFYRVPDVYLMKAEALVERNHGSDLSDALSLVNLTYMRSNPEGVPLLESEYSGKEKMRDLVLLERQREFLFEGKRWFDLVRLARKEDKNYGDNEHGVDNHPKMLDLVVRKYDRNGGVVKSKMRNSDALYLPISEKELISNRALKQNPYYDEFTTKETDKK